MKRPVKIAVAAGVVAIALAGGWVLTRPTEQAPAGATDSVNQPAPLLTAPTAATVANVIPHDVTWQLSNLVAVPISPTAGPARTSPEGIQSGFSHNPPGALLAAANWSAAAAQIITNPATGVPLVQQRMMPWPGRAQALADAQQAVGHPGPPTPVMQIEGFRYLTYDGNHATLVIAKQVTTGASRIGYADYITLVWSASDWWVVPAVDGHGEIGAPATFPLTAAWTRFAGVA